MSRTFSIALALFVLSCSRQEMATVAPTASGVGTANGPAVLALPCEAANLLAARCWTCHGTTPVGDAPMSLVTYGDLLEPSLKDPTLTMAQSALLRMQGGAMPMPPLPDTAVDADALAAFKAWVDGGVHAGQCDVVDPFAGPSVCTSGEFFEGDRETPVMHPGVACIDCHSQERGPRFKFAGTVFPTAHEPDDCDGVGGLQVVVTGADGKSVTMNVNSAGNFYTNSSVGMPYTAKVVDGGKTRVMATPQTSGDCNGCHTQSGDEGAPGRVLAP